LPLLELLSFGCFIVETFVVFVTVGFFGDCETLFGKPLAGILMPPMLPALPGPVVPSPCLITDWHSRVLPLQMKQVCEPVEHPIKSPFLSVL